MKSRVSLVKYVAKSLRANKAEGLTWDGIQIQKNILSKKAQNPKMLTSWLVKFAKGSLNKNAGCYLTTDLMRLTKGKKQKRWMIMKTKKKERSQKMMNRVTILKTKMLSLRNFRTKKLSKVLKKKNILNLKRNTIWLKLEVEQLLWLTKLN